jgi:hypothetical protein
MTTWHYLTLFITWHYSILLNFTWLYGIYPYFSTLLDTTLGWGQVAIKELFIVTWLLASFVPSHTAYLDITDILALTDTLGRDLLFSSLNPGSCAWHYSICLSHDTDLLRASLLSPHHVVSSYKPMTDNLWDSLYTRLCTMTRLLYMSTQLYHSLHDLLTLRPAFTIHYSTSLFSRPSL